jgi:hypothetical protein
MTHFRCPICSRIRLSSSHLQTHVSTVHKQIPKKVPNAVEGRESPDNAVFGMRGIPENVYVTWLTSVDPEFKKNAQNVNLDGAYLANDAMRIAAMNLIASTSNVAFSEVNQFLRANVQVNQGMGTVVTARGVVPTDDLARATKRRTPDDVAAFAAQRRYENGMRMAREIIEEAMAQGVRERRERLREQKRTEVMYFEPIDGLSVFEMRARYLRARKLEAGAVPPTES